MSPRSSVRVARQPLSMAAKDILTFLTEWSAVKDHDGPRDKAKARIKKFFDAVRAGDLNDMHVTVDSETGSEYYDFEEPKVIGSRTFEGVENRCTISSSVDLSRVEEWLEGLPEADARKYRKMLFKEVKHEEFQEDGLYVLNQLGILPDEMLDADNEKGFVTTSKSYALWAKLAL